MIYNSEALKIHKIYICSALNFYKYEEKRKQLGLAAWKALKIEHKISIIIILKFHTADDIKAGFFSGPE